MFKSFVNDADGYSIKDHIANTLLLLLSVSVSVSILLMVISVFINISDSCIDHSIEMTKYMIGIDTIVIPFYFGSKSYDNNVNKKVVVEEDRR